jgi:DNA-binding NarL/FixJ family response regulator
VNIRILVADDFEPWRRFVSWLIALRKPEWNIVCEVSDGVEAVEKAGDLKPELILLDIGLPKLDGIEAARQISQIASYTKILFLSGFDSLEVVEEALNTGANGYVLKLDAASELIEAVEAVFQGKRFVSSRLAGRISA